MSFLRLFSMLSVSLLTYTYTASIAPSLSQAQPARSKFYCGTHQNVPTTMARTSRGPVPVIHWVSNAFGENFPPESRCNTVSARFQDYYDNGTLNFLTTAVLNKQPAICAVKFKGGPCGLLFTLQAGRDPNLTLKRLLNIRDRATSVALNESIGASFIDMNEFLNNAPTERTSATSAPNLIPNARPSSSSSNPSGSNPSGSDVPSSAGKSIW
jgi:Circadian oscillating protein COP23